MIQKTLLRTAVICFLALFSTGSKASAQVLRDVSLQSGLPAVLEGEAFATADAVALYGERRLVVGINLRQSPQFLTIAPQIASLEMASAWTRIDATRALYLAKGNDGLPGTSDDALALITGLPAAPQFQPLGILWGTTPQNWLVLGSDAIIENQRRGNSLWRLRLDAPFPQIESLPLGLNLGPNDPRFPWMRVDQETAAILAAGPDGAYETGDEFLVVVSKLGGPASAIQVRTEALGLPFSVSGSLGLKSGVIVLQGATQPIGFPEEMGLAVVDVRGAGYQLLSIDTTVFAVSLPPLGPGMLPTTGLLPGYGDDDFIAWMEDEFFDRSYALFTEASNDLGDPTGTWADSALCGCTAELVGRTLLMQNVGSGSSGFALFDFVQSPGTPVYVDPVGDAKAPFVLAPVDGSLVLARATPGFNGGPARIATSVLYGGHEGQVRGDRFERVGEWTSGGFSQTSGAPVASRLFPVGTGMVLGFFSVDSDPEPEFARLITVPSTAVVGAGNSDSDDDEDFEMRPLGLLPQPNATVGSGIALEADSSFDPFAFVLFASERLAQPWSLGAQAFFEDNSLLHIDPFRAELLLVAPLSSATIDLPFSISPLAQISLAGRAFFIQAVARDASNGNWHCSDCWQVVPF